MRTLLLASTALSLLLAACGEPDKPDDTGQETGEDSPVETSTWYADADGDGYGDSAVSQEAATPPSGFVDNADDCDDSDAAVNPGAEERCDGIDNDCDGEVDGEAAVDRLSCHLDADGDGYGDPASLVEECACADGWVDNAEDCDDGCDQCWTGALEVCEDGFDNDCDGWDDQCLLEGDYVMADADVTILGEEEDGDLGRYAFLSGDLTGDGHQDIVLYQSSPSLTIVSGTIEGTNDLSAVSIASITGDRSAGESIGYPSSIGDIDGDGHADLFFRNSYDDSARIFAGPIIGDWATTDYDYRIAIGELSGLERQPILGFPSGDLDGDGSDDLLLCASSLDGDTSYDGGVALFHGPITGDTSLAAADVLWTSGVSAVGLGKASSTGDIDGDGILDAVFGAPAGVMPGNSSRAYLLYGPLSVGGVVGGSGGVEDALLEGDGWDDTGGDVAASADLDGDGLADIVLGAHDLKLEHKVDYHLGAVYVLYGAVSGELELSEHADAVIFGDGRGDYLGNHVEVGDIDGDGFGDLAASAYGDNADPSDAGAIHIFYDAPSGVQYSLDADVILRGNAEQDFAYVLSTSGDIDGDGFADILVGAWGDDSNATDAGAAYLFYGGGG
jgi:hypothetical protein